MITTATTVAALLVLAGLQMRLRGYDNAKRLALAALGAAIVGGAALFEARCSL